MRRLFLLATLALLTSFGCVGSRGQLAACAPGEPNCRDLVFVADGAGDFRAASQTVDRVVHAECLPLCVEPILWSHGYGRVFIDQIARGYATERGRCLAAELQKRRAAQPGVRIYLLAHSAGSRVVLAAAEAMPPDSIERIVLLGPSVQATYDLRCALKATRRSIDVYYSPARDQYLKGAAILAAVFHGEFSRRAGQIGFTPVIESDDDAKLYEKLRLIPWDPTFEESGNRGGHYGGYQPEFLKEYVLPLMQH
jgi:pimeloyl-ACP methyl ester carboxylesterase